MNQGSGEILATPLQLALGNGHFNLAKVLVKHGADVFKKDTLGVGALTYGTISQSVKTVVWVVNAGVDVNALNCLGGTSLMFSLQEDAIDTLSDHLYQQQKQLEKLQQEFQLVKGWIKETISSPSMETSSEVDETPPHY